MPAGGDIIELVHEQGYLGQVVNNVYYFEAAIVDASMANLATWFETNVVPDIKANQLDLVTHVNLRLRNLFNLAETYEEPLTGTGTIISGQTELPSFMAYTVRFDHTNGAVRPGFKRWTGVDETSLVDALLGSGPITRLIAIGANLVNPPADSNPDWAHVIVGRVCETPNPVPDAVPSCLKYRLPENQGELEVGYPVTFEAYAQPTTQNSRKWYR